MTREELQAETGMTWQGAEEYYEILKNCADIGGLNDAGVSELHESVRGAADHFEGDDVEKAYLFYGHAALAGMLYFMARQNLDAFIHSASSRHGRVTPQVKNSQPSLN